MLITFSIKQQQAANELAQHLASKDDTPLNKAKLQNTYLLKKQAPVTEQARVARAQAQKARAPFEQARKAAEAERAKVSQSLQLPILKQYWSVSGNGQGWRWPIPQAHFIKRKPSFALAES